jgi:aminoglycoside phosphotransferase (APT) family kinase protein
VGRSEPKVSEATDGAESLARELLGALQRRWPDASQVSGLRRLAAGATQETWAFDARRGGRLEPLILRRTAPGMERDSSDNRIAVDLEVQVLQVARAGGVPVPAVAFALEPADELGQGFVMERIEGETIPRKLLRDPAYAGAREKLAAQCGAALARIHALDPARAPELPLAPVRAQLERQRRTLDRALTAQPVLELALRWLEERAPADALPRVVHGDFRNGNLIVGPEGLRAVLDWEIAHRGDPAEDLGWFCANVWRFGASDKRAGGFGTLEQLLDGYVAAGGEAIALERVLWWEVLASLKWAAGCILMQLVFTSGADRSVERAAIGRRVSENDVDLLNLIAPRRTG